MAELRDEIAAYDRMHADLEAAHLGEWALVHDEELIGTYSKYPPAKPGALLREPLKAAGRGR
jgi:hypothetical protein